ncbi:Membrane protein [Moritella viscosa]
MRTMPANISCDMPDMPCNSQSSMSKMQHDNPQLQHSKNQYNDDDCSDCNTTCVSSFINYNNKPLLNPHKQSNSLRYELTLPLKQHQDSLYRPPLIS